MSFDVRMPDGTLIRNVPAGTTQDDILERYTLSKQPAQPAQPAAAVRPRQGEYTAEQMAPATPEDMGFSGEAPSSTTKAVGRTLLGIGKGIVNPALAVGQFVAPETTRDLLSRYNESRAELGGQGVDVGEIIGTVINPLNRLFPGATAATATGRAAQFAGQGAVLGVLTPAQEAESLLTEKLKQAGAGALFGGILSGALDLGKGAFNIAKEFAKPVTTAGQKTILQQRLVELAGKEPEKIISALRNAPEIVPGSKPTAAEALADIPAATSLAAFQKGLEKTPAKGIAADFAVRRADVANARQALLRKTGGTQDDLIEAIAERTRVTAPIREDALAQANIAGRLEPQFEKEIASKFQSRAKALQVGGKLETEAAQLMRPTTPITDFERRVAQATGNEIPDVSWRRGASFYPVEGMPAVPVAYRPQLNKDFLNVLGNLEGATASKNIAAQRLAEGQFKKLQLQSLAENGFYPLRVNPIIENIDNVLTKPGTRSSDVVVNVFGSLREKLQRLSDPNTGVIDSNDLYTIRKEIGNDIKKFSQESQNWDARLTSGLEKNVKSYIDNAIEKAGNSGDWKRYLETFQQQSNKINQMQIAQALEKQIGTPLGNAERVAGFAAAVENAPNLIKRSTGQARFQKLDEIMTKKQMADIDSLMKDVSREARGDTLASLSTAEGQALLELPNLLNRYALITNTVLKLIKKDATQDINRLAADMALNPKLLASFIEGVPPSKAQAVVKALYSKLTPENQEALNRALVIRAVVPQITEGE
jgi:ligand-binding SRPBCC domain-containing protein